MTGCGPCNTGYILEGVCLMVIKGDCWALAGGGMRSTECLSSYTRSVVCGRPQCYKTFVRLLAFCCKRNAKRCFVNSESMNGRTGNRIAGMFMNFL